MESVTLFKTFVLPNDLCTFFASMIAIIRPQGNGIVEVFVYGKKESEVKG
jgi:hypothetical protein